MLRLPQRGRRSRVKLPTDEDELPTSSPWTYFKSRKAAEVAAAGGDDGASYGVLLGTRRVPVPANASGGGEGTSYGRAEGGETKLKRIAKKRRRHPEDETEDARANCAGVGRRDSGVEESMPSTVCGLKHAVESTLTANQICESADVLFLTAATDLSSPEGSPWKQPLVHCVVEPVDPETVEIAVYAQRLLFELIACPALKTLMELVEPGAGTVTVPRCELSAPPQPSFRVGGDGSCGEKDDEWRFSHEGLLASCLHSGYAAIPRQPDGLTMKLKRYQLQTVQWMLDMERIDNINRLFWEERRVGGDAQYFYSPALGELRLSLPGESFRGGMLASDMGLGKTVMILSLIALDKSSESGTTDRGPTLILVPAPLVSQWVAEADRCFAAGVLTVRLLDDLMPLVIDARGTNGANRMRDISHVDVVIATYQDVKDASRKKGPKKGRGLFEQRWRRVVCDECQEVRKGHQLLSRGARRLQAQRRWLCSGTPVRFYCWRT